MRATATLLTSLAMALAAFGLAVAAPRDPDGPRTRLLAASGPIVIANSKDGQAVFSATGVRPGEERAGVVQIGNDGTDGGRLSLRLDGLEEQPGIYGGQLSQALSLVVADITDPQRPATVYAGLPAGLRERPLGVFAAGERREYRIAATLPDTGVPGSATTGDNRFQGARLTFGLEWRALATAPFVTPTPVATPTPVPAAPAAPAAPAPAVPSRTPAPRPAAGSGTASDVLGEALGLPSARRCVSRRRLKIRLRAPGGRRVVSATVRVGRKKRRTVRGCRAIVLRRLPAKRRFTVKITVRTTDGRVYRSKRRYRACRVRLPA